MNVIRQGDTDRYGDLAHDLLKMRGEAWDGFDHFLDGRLDVM